MKKILSVLLALCLLVGCVPFYAGAETAANLETQVFVQFDNDSKLELTPAKPYLCFDSDTNAFIVKGKDEVADGNWKAMLELTEDGSENVTGSSVTIKDLTAHVISFKRVFVDGDTIPATLIFQGTSTIGNDSMSGGLSVTDCDLTIRGADASSTLTVIGGILLGGSTNTGKTITFESGTVDVVGKNNGINLFGNLTVTNANVTATATAQGGNDALYFAGICAQNITVNGGSLTGVTNIENRSSHGIYTKEKLTVTGGTLTGKGGDDNPSDGTVGIEVIGGFEASGGTVTGTGATKGINLSGLIDISGGAKVTGTSTNVAGHAYSTTNYGIWLQPTGDSAIKSNALVTGTGNQNGLYIYGPLTVDGGTVIGQVEGETSQDGYGINANYTENGSSESYLTFKSGTVTGDGGSSSGSVGLAADKLGFGCSKIKYKTSESDTGTEYTPAAGKVFSGPYEQRYFSMQAGDGDTSTELVTVNVGKAGHEHEWSKDWTNNETHHWHECTAGSCDIDNSEKKDYAEHSWGEGSVTKEPTTEADGIRTYTCECGKTKTEAIPKKHTHEWATAWSSNAEGHWHACTVDGCDEKKDSAAHNWGDWVIDQEATAIAAGSKHRVCSACNYTETVSIPATGGNTGPSSPSTPDPTPSTPAEEVNKTPTVSGGTANTTISSSEGSSLVAEAQKPASGEVTVKVEPTGKADTVNVTLPASTVTGVGAAKTDLKVETPVADITLPGETLTGLGTGASNVTVSAAVNSDETVSITVRKDNTTVTALAQPMRASIPAENVTGSTVAVLVDENGKETVIPKSISSKDEIKLLLGGSAKIKLKDNSKDFDDTQGHWADSEGAVGFVSSRELFKGTSDTSFSPETTMTRGMMVTVLHRLESTPKGGSVSFGDVSADAYFAEAVAWGNANDIVKGDGNNFLPNDNVTREQLATFLYRYASKYGVDTTGRTNLASFPDSGNVSGYAKCALEWAYYTGLIKGTDGRLNPAGNAKRGEVAAILMRFVQYINK